MIALFLTLGLIAPVDSLARWEAIAPVAPPPVFEWLDEGNTEELLALSPKKLRSALEKGRKLVRTQPVEEKRKLRDEFDRNTDLFVVIPPKPRGVLFLLHGLGGNGRQLIDHYKPWAAERGLIIAAPTAKRPPNAAKNEDWTEASGNLPHWWSYQPGGFVLSALKQLKRQYPIDEDHVFLSGYSMGGFGTWNLGLRYPDRFAALVPMAGGVSQREYFGGEDHDLRKILANAINTPIYFIHGDRDGTVEVEYDRRSARQLKELDYDHTYVEVPGGGHVLDVRKGSRLMLGIQKWAEKRKRNPHPKRVRFHSLGDYMNQSYWVRIDERIEDGPAEVTAQIGKRNKIAVETQNVKKLTIFLDEEHIKLSRTVSVVVDGKQKHKGKVKASSEVLLESWHAREDRKLLYGAKVEIDLAKSDDSD
ncbi:MAG: alpha/beta hydrolase-fold protein [Planctomycetota bacterium]